MSRPVVYVQFLDDRGKVRAQITQTALIDRTRRWSWQTFGPRGGQRARGYCSRFRVAMGMVMNRIPGSAL